MTVDRTRCLGPKRGDGRIFPDRCQADAAYDTPNGPRCADCAEEEMRVIREGSCLLAILADERGVSRERLLSKYRKRETKAV